MKKILILTILVFTFNFIIPTLSFAQENNTVSQNSDGHTAREEAEGKEVWEKLEAEELRCENLTDQNFGAVGEYFMGQVMGDSHESMNNIMIQMMGEEGEEEMHVALGKRMSECEPNATMPQNMINSGMMGNQLNPFTLNNNFNNPMSMMNFSFVPFGWILMILFWALIIVGIIALIKWIIGQNKPESKNHKSALDILKERYAKGEIDKKEFEEKKEEIE